MKSRSLFMLSGLAALAAVQVGCASKVDAFTIKRVLDRAVKIPDVGEGCYLGAASRNAIAAITNEKRPARKALLISESSAAMCAEQPARELELAGLRAKKNLTSLGAARANEIKDLRAQEQRAHADAAMRYHRAFQLLEEEWGPAGDGECPKIKERDEIAYLMGLFSGLNGVLHDRGSGGMIGVPLDTVQKVARASECLPNDKWWNVPKGMQAAAWAVIPGSGPEGVDPWQVLEEQAVAGEKSGVRLARALQVAIAANSGNDEVLEAGIKAHAKALETMQANPDWLLLDEFARQVTRHESDLIWTQAKGYRASTLGELPSDDAPVEETGGPDPFGGGDDPFGGGGGDDPFGDGPTDEPSDEAPAPDDGAAPAPKPEETP